MDEENVLFEDGQLGDHSPEALIRTVWYFLTLHFGMRGRDEHHKLRYGDLKLLQDSNGEYLQWCFERGTKTRTGEVSGSMNRAFQPKMFATNTDRCPVYFFKAFISYRPESSNYPESPFYLGIKHKRPSDANIWYINCPMGINTLGNFMKTASAAVGIDGKRVTNHSIRKTMIQRLVDSKFPPIEVAQLSGHKT